MTDPNRRMVRTRADIPALVKDFPLLKRYEQDMAYELDTLGSYEIHVNRFGNGYTKTGR